jgi:hypothetical protein
LCCASFHSGLILLRRSRRGSHGLERKGPALAQLRSLSLSLSKDEAVTEEREKVSRMNCGLPGQPARSGKEEKKVSSAAWEW